MATSGALGNGDDADRQHGQSTVVTKFQSLRAMSAVRLTSGCR